MKTRALKNYDSSVGCEAYDIDWNNNEEIIELGKLAASQCIVFVDDPVPVTTVAQSMRVWGDPAGAIMHEYITSKRIDGRHWREVFLMLGYTVTDLPKELYSNVSRVTYSSDEKGRPKGIFSSGELDWHSDQCAFDDAQRIIALQSVSDSVNSQTTFLCTHDAFESLSSDMQSTIKELYVKHRWQDGIMAPGLNSAQTLVIHYNMVPLDGMETRLYRETASGLPGMKLPTHSFDGFVGMSMEESQKIIKVIREAVFKPQYVYTRDWQDGQVMFMDQEITLHARPTNVTHGSKRNMLRTIGYVNHIFPNNTVATHVRYQGKMISHNELAALVDQDRLRKFEQEQQGDYVSMSDEVYADK